MPLPDADFDVTEVTVPWRLLREAGHDVVFATEQAGTVPAAADPLTPSCRTVLDATGIAFALDAHGFVLKYGGAIRWADDAWFFD